MKILYVLIRADLPSMGYGKGAAQATHAANAFTEFEVIRPLEGKRQGNPDVKEWREQTEQGFGTVLTLSIPDLTTLRKVIDAADTLGYPARVITDPTYPYFVSNEIAPLIDERRHTLPPSPAGRDKMVCFRTEDTCGFVFGEKETLDVLLARFNLLSND